MHAEIIQPLAPFSAQSPPSCYSEQRPEQRCRPEQTITDTWGRGTARSFFSFLSKLNVYINNKYYKTLLHFPLACFPSFQVHFAIHINKWSWIIRICKGLQQPTLHDSSIVNGVCKNIALNSNYRGGTWPKGWNRILTSVQYLLPDRYCRT